MIRESKSKPPVGNRWPPPARGSWGVDRQGSRSRSGPRVVNYPLKTSIKRIRRRRCAGYLSFMVPRGKLLRRM
jgi:hypothetical protein